VFFENYLKKYLKKDKRVMSACFEKFKEFMKAEEIKSLTTKMVNASIVTRFKEYLVENLNGETPSNYFKKFKKVLRYGIKEKIFTDEISALLSSRDNDMKIKRNSGIKKEILSFEEIQTLASTETTNTEVKRAFLFSCLTGLRFCDIKTLKWKNIQRKILNITQQKTNSPVTINLNQSAIDILGKAGKGDEEVFILPSHTACLNNLDNWCKKAKIEKHITWHCARHSFGTGIILYGGDVKNASALLGHNSLAYTDGYVRIAEKLKEKTVANLPEIKIKLQI
jgi:site-specific recombinase XerD